MRMDLVVKGCADRANGIATESMLTPNQTSMVWMDNYKLHRLPDMTEARDRLERGGEVDHSILSRAKVVCYSLFSRLIPLDGERKCFDEALDDEKDDNADREERDEPEEDQEDDEVEESED